MIRQSRKASSPILGRKQPQRSEEHTSELQSRSDIVCRLLLEKRLGSIDYDTPTYTYVDSSGKMYVTGAIKGNADLSGDGDYLDGGESSIGYGNYDGFISVFDASGGYLWSKRLGGVSNDQGLSVVTDASGNVIVTGIVLGNADLSG